MLPWQISSLQSVLSTGFCDGAAHRRIQPKSNATSQSADRDTNCRRVVFVLRIPSHPCDTGLLRNSPDEGILAVPGVKLLIPIDNCLKSDRPLTFPMP